MEDVCKMYEMKMNNLPVDVEILIVTLVDGVPTPTTLFLDQTSLPVNEYLDCALLEPYRAL